MSVRLQERVSEREAAAQQLAVNLADSQRRCAATAAALAAAEAALAAGHARGSARSQSGSCSPADAGAVNSSAHVQQPATPPQAAALGAAAPNGGGDATLSTSAGDQIRAECTSSGASSAACASDFEFRIGMPPAAAASFQSLLPQSQDAADAAADLRRWTQVLQKADYQSTEEFRVDASNAEVASAFWSFVVQMRCPALLSCRTPAQMPRRSCGRRGSRPRRCCSRCRCGLTMRWHLIQTFLCQSSALELHHASPG